MTTILDLEKENKYGDTETHITEKFELACKFSVYGTGKLGCFGNKRNTVYRIENDDILDTLRQLYVSTKNNFVKKVVKTVGTSKTFTENQLWIIAEELAKFNQITINF